jgi:hypothetical protein
MGVGFLQGLRPADAISRFWERLKVVSWLRRGLGVLGQMKSSLVQLDYRVYKLARLLSEYIGLRPADAIGVGEMGCPVCWLAG